MHFKQIRCTDYCICPERFYKKKCSWKFRKTQRKSLRQSLFFNNVASFRLQLSKKFLLFAGAETFKGSFLFSLLVNKANLWIGLEKVKVRVSRGLDMNEIFNNFTNLYKQGLQCRAIKKHRFAISICHESVKGKPVGKHPRVCFAYGSV